MKKAIYLITITLISFAAAAQTPELERVLEELVATDRESNIQQAIEQYYDSSEVNTSYFSKRIYHALMLRLSYKKHKADHNPYVGSNLNNMLRYKVRFSKYVDAGIITEKDAGERYWMYQPEYMAFYTRIRDMGILKDMVIGHYDLSIGYGLSVNSSAMFRSFVNSGFSTPPRLVVKPHFSSREYKYYQGVATVIQHKQFQFQFFLSSKKRDAGFRIMPDNSIVITSILQSGNHRNSLEEQKRNRIQNITYGGAIKLRFPFKNKMSNQLMSLQNRISGEIGVLYIANHFDLAISPNERPDNVFAFHGREHYLYGAFFRSQIRNLMIYSEYSGSSNRGWACVGGMKAMTFQNASLEMQYLHISHNYQNLSSDMFRYMQNYQKASLRLHTSFLAGSELLMASELHKRPWISYQHCSPQTEYNLFAEIRYKLFHRNRLFTSGNNQHLYARISYRSNQLRFRIHARIQFNPYLTSDQRIEIHPQAKLLYQQLKFTGIKMPLQCIIRYTLFNTQGWDSRIYAYENDVLYDFSIPALYHQGMKLYLLFRYNILPELSVWLRYEYTSYTRKHPINTDIPENQSEIKMQIRYAL